MLYLLAKILMTIGLRFFFRHIHVTGLEVVPEKGPAIIIANHPSSLMDAAVLGILLKRKVYYFTRGDVFLNRPVAKMLSWLHMLPVHQHLGGKSSMGVNDDSFSAGQKILTRGGIIVFFPESTSHVERQLYPLRKGVFRLAFSTALANQFNFDIPIIPVGITYFHPTKSRKDVLVHAGQPILLSEYRSLFEENSSAALLRISKDAYQQLYKLTLHIDDETRLTATEQLLKLDRSETPEQTGWKIPSPERFNREKQICAIVNHLPDKEITALQRSGEAYFEELGKHQIDETAFASKTQPVSPVLLIAGFPFYVAGMILTGPPILLARYIADKKVYRKDFYAWIYVAGCALLSVPWWSLVALLALLAGWQWMLGILFLMMATGILAFAYKGWRKRIRMQSRRSKLPMAVQETLTAHRAALLRYLPAR